MNDAHGVKILQDSKNLLDNLTGIIFLYMTATALLFTDMLLNVVVKLTSLVKISDDVVSICIFEPLEYAHDSWMIKLRENLNLCVTLLSNVVEQLKVTFVDYFHSPEIACLPVDTEPDVAIAALFANLLSDSVDAVDVTLIFEDEIADTHLKALHLLNHILLVNCCFLVRSLAIYRLGFDTKVAVSGVVLRSFGLFTRV